MSAPLTTPSSPQAELPDGVMLVDYDKRPPGCESVPGVECPPGKIAIRFFHARDTVIPGDEPASSLYSTRSLTLSQDEARARVAKIIERRLEPKGAIAPTEGEEQRRQRELREADVVEAARRSQAEIRRHVDSYLKEYMEVIAGDIAAVILKRATEAVVKGIAGMQEQQVISLDRVASDVRSQMRRFFRDGFVPAKPARKMPTRKVKNDFTP